jgi:hypothetical protein
MIPTSVYESDRGAELVGAIRTKNEDAELPPRTVHVPSCMETHSARNI